MGPYRYSGELGALIRPNWMGVTVLAPRRIAPRAVGAGLLYCATQEGAMAYMLRLASRLKGHRLRRLESWPLARCASLLSDATASYRSHLGLRLLLVFAILMRPHALV